MIKVSGRNLESIFLLRYCSASKQEEKEEEEEEEGIDKVLK